MSQGKYSPRCPHCNDGYEFEFNCYGKPVTDMVKGVPYNVMTMFGNYDNEGFDRYGYSCFDAEGNYVGIGSGVDRLGYTEFDYLVMDPDQYADLY